jgi:hypothetical protein
MRRPRLTTRDLIWLVLVCALAAGWWAERRRAVRAANIALDALRRVDAVQKGAARATTVPAPAPTP